MDLKQIPLISLARQKLDWLGQRQQVLAQNIANADTPDYRARDLKPFEFREMVRAAPSQVNMEATSEGHLPGRRKKETEHRSSVERRPYETAPAGNAVILEEQMGKVNETSLSYSLANELYRKQLGMFRTAATGR